MGQTDISPGALTMRIMADDAAGLIQELGIGKVHVLGISMGGKYSSRGSAQPPVDGSVLEVRVVSSCIMPSSAGHGRRVLEAPANRHLATHEVLPGAAKIVGKWSAARRIGSLETAAMREVI
jgi:pimeloyl-ACP methyl ester carboxylesterase